MLGVLLRSFTCRTLHPKLKKIAADNPDVLFLVSQPARQTDSRACRLAPAPRASHACALMGVARRTQQPWPGGLAGRQVCHACLPIDAALPPSRAPAAEAKWVL